MRKYVLENKNNFIEALTTYEKSKCGDSSRFAVQELGRISWNIYTEISNRDLKKFSDKFPNISDPFDFECDYKDSKCGAYPEALVELCSFVYGIK